MLLRRAGLRPRFGRGHRLARSRPRRDAAVLGQAEARVGLSGREVRSGQSSEVSFLVKFASKHRPGPGLDGEFMPFTRAIYFSRRPPMVELLLSGNCFLFFFYFFFSHAFVLLLGNIDIVVGEHRHCCWGT